MSIPELARYDKLAFGYDHLCVSVVKGMTVAQALDRLGLTAEPLDADAEWEEEDPAIIMLGEVGDDLVTFDLTGAGRFSMDLWTLAEGHAHGQAQWNYSNAAVYFRTADGAGYGWDRDHEDREPSAYPHYDDLFEHIHEVEPRYEGGVHTVMLAILDRELDIRLDEVETELTHSVDLSGLRRAGS